MSARRVSISTASASRAALALVGVALAVACAVRRPQPVTVAELVTGGARVTDRPIVVAGRATAVLPHLPEQGTAGIEFRLSDGTGTIDVVHEGMLNVREGALLQVRGVRRQRADGKPYLLAKKIWFIAGGAPA